MLPKIDPTKTRSWAALTKHYQEIKDQHMKDWFAADPDRFGRLSRTFEDMLVDFSKNRVTDQTMELLLQLAEETGVSESIGQMFAGEEINATEGRAVLHTALRNRSGRQVVVGGEDVMPAVQKVLDRMKAFCENIHQGNWKGYTGQSITDVVNIGIGGSDLGPVMVTEALKAFQKPSLEVHFVSNVDGTHLSETLRTLDPETTLFLIASKTFTTQETMTNAFSARAWFWKKPVRKNTLPGISQPYQPMQRALPSLGLIRKICLNSGTGSEAVIL